LLYRNLAFEAYVSGLSSIGDDFYTISSLHFEAFSGILRKTKGGVELGASIHGLGNSLTKAIEIRASLLTAAKIDKLISSAQDVFDKMEELQQTEPKPSNETVTEKLLNEIHSQVISFILAMEG